MARPINETERQERIAMVDSVVNQLRAVGEKITRRKIAEGIGVTEQYLNSKDRHGNRNYLTEYVDSIIEAEKRQAAEEVGDISGRFNYELVCDISKRVPRIYEE